MDTNPGAQTDSRSEVTGPRVLSLHPTSICALNCAPCYLKRNMYEKEKPLSFFAAIVREASLSQSLREVAIAVNIDPRGMTRNRDALRIISEAARESGINLSATTNYENVKDWGAAAFSGCHFVSLSIDEYKFPSMSPPSDFFEVVTQLQAEGVVVNLNVMLSKPMLEHLTLARLRRWLGSADQVYLIVPKHYTLDFSREDLLAFFARLSPIWEDPDRFFHLQVDNCIKPEVFPWNQLTPSCEWAENLVNILPDGGLTLCAMDVPQVRLTTSGDLLGTIDRYYIERRHTSRSRCPFIDFAVRSEAQKAG